MGKLIWTISSTLDGFITDDEGGMAWIVIGQGREAHFVKEVKNAATAELVPGC